jgi:hypothetical protein
VSDWASPIDRWVLSATDRQEKPLHGSTRLMLVALHSRADAPSKRSGPGPLFVFGEKVQLDALAGELLVGLRAADTQFGALRAAGLVKRGYDWVLGARRYGIWLADVPNTGRFGDEGSPIQTSDEIRSVDRAQQDSHDQTSGSDPIQTSDEIRSVDRIGSDLQIGLLNKEDPISTRSAPDQYPVGVGDTEAEPAQPAQPSLFGGIHAADPIEALRSLHEQLSLEAYAKHGRRAKNGQALGSLPKRGTASGKALVQRIKAAVRDHGFDRCEEAIRWRAAEWAANIEQLSRPPEQAWHTKSLAFVMGKLDAGIAPPGCGNIPEGNRLAVSRGEAPSSSVYAEGQDMFMGADGNFDYDAARSYFEQEGGS